MSRKNRTDFRYTIIILTCVVCAVALRMISKMVHYSTTFGLMRTFIYIGLYLAWGITIQKRVIHDSIRRFLLVIVGLMIFWLTVRTCKYFFAIDLPLMTRLLWYSYYLPMLFIPYCSFCIALLLGKPESSRVPLWARLILIPTLLFFLLVLSNDVHQLVFSFPADAVWSDRNNGYEPGYYFVLGWMIILALGAFVVMVWKCRLAQRKKYLPAVFLFCSIAYALIYVTKVPWIQALAGDITAGQCLMFMIILESCIQCGLIPTNTGYEELFEISNLGAQTADQNNNIRYASANAPHLSTAMILDAQKGKVYLDPDTILRCNPIHGGYVYWQENLREITELLKQLEQNQKQIARNNDVEEKNYRTKIRIHTLREKTRLYEQLQEQTSSQIDLLDDLLTRYEAADDPVLQRSLLARIGVIGTYLKRRGNLVFIGEKTVMTDTAELAACLEESFMSLRLMDVDCAIDIPVGEKISVVQVNQVYDFFEGVIEKSLGHLYSVWLKARNLEDSILFTLEVETSEDLTDFVKEGDMTDCEDGVWRFTYSCKKRR